MAKPREHLSRAPIVEALIDFRVLAREGAAAEMFSDLSPRLAASYPKSAPMRSIQTRFDLEQGKLSALNQVSSEIGWIFESHRRESVAQFRIDGFTYSKLQPYTRWEDVFAEAYRLWLIYVEISKPLDVSRLAVRYINRLRLPASAELRDYLEAPPALPPRIPQVIREFLTRIVVLDSERGFSAIITQALEVSLDPSVSPILLDIDAFRESTIPPDDSSLPLVFEHLRQLKNQIFFASITEKTVEMYE